MSTAITREAAANGQPRSRMNPGRGLSGVRTYRGTVRVSLPFAVWLLLVGGSPGVFAHGDVHLRIAALRLQILQEPDNARLYLQRGEAHRENLDWPAAEADYDQAAQLDPRLAAVELCRGKLLADLGRTNEARSVFDQYLERFPEDGEALIVRARLLARLGETRLAIEDYNRGLKHLQNPQAEFYLERAQLQAGAGQHTAALRGLQEGIENLGPLVALQLYALDLEIERRNFDGALSRLDDIMAQSQRKERWLARRGEILRAAGRSAEARAAFEDSLSAAQRLPPRLQQSPLVIELLKRVSGELQAMTNALPNSSHPGRQSDVSAAPVP